MKLESKIERFIIKVGSMGGSFLGEHNAVHTPTLEVLKEELKDLISKEELKDLISTEANKRLDEYYERVQRAFEEERIAGHMPLGSEDIEYIVRIVRENYKQQEKQG